MLVWEFIWQAWRSKLLQLSMFRRFVSRTLRRILGHVCVLWVGCSMHIVVLNIFLIFVIYHWYAIVKLSIFIAHIFLLIVVWLCSSILIFSHVIILRCCVYIISFSHILKMRRDYLSTCYWRHRYALTPVMCAEIILPHLKKTYKKHVMRFFSHLSLFYRLNILKNIRKYIKSAWKSYLSQLHMLCARSHVHECSFVYLCVQEVVPCHI